VYVPQAKGTHYFDKYYQKGVDWYTSFFAKAGKETKAIGDICHNYLYSREAALRIYKDLPEVKLFASIRNPLERFLSAYMFARRNKLTQDNVEDTLKNYPHIIKFGKYYNYLAMYKESFGEQRFKVFLFDDLIRDPWAFASKIYEFIGVNPNFEYLDAEKKVLPASNYRIGWLAFFVKKTAIAMRNMGFASLVGKFKDSFIPSLLYKESTDEDKMSLTEEQKIWLIKYYAEDVAKTEELLGRDLSHWLQ